MGPHNWIRQWLYITRRIVSSKDFLGFFLSSLKTLPVKLKLKVVAMFHTTAVFAGLRYEYISGVLSAAETTRKLNTIFIVDTAYRSVFLPGSTESKPTSFITS